MKGKFLCSVWRQSGGPPLCSDCRSGWETCSLLCDGEGRGSGQRIEARNCRTPQFSIHDLATDFRSWQQHWCSRKHVRSVVGVVFPNQKATIGLRIGLWISINHPSRLEDNLFPISKGRNFKILDDRKFYFPGFSKFTFQTLPSSH